MAIHSGVQIALGKKFQMKPALLPDEAAKLVSIHVFDLILLDINLPGTDGFRLFAHLRSHGINQDISVILLTGSNDLADKALGFSLGAEDYIIKPFNAEELRIRIESKICKTRKSQRSGLYIDRDNLKINIETHQAWLYDGKCDIPLSLTPIEFKLLCLLARQPNIAFTREQLLRTAWGNNTHVLDRTIDRHISTLRHKLGPCGPRVATIAAVGYKFT